MEDMTREDFERNINLLREAVNNGKFHMRKDDERTADGLIRVRSLPNGRIDFLTIDEGTRLLANMQAHNWGNFLKEKMNRNKNDEI